MLPTREDLLLKAELLVAGVDFSAAGILQRLAGERKVRSGTGLYNYHRADAAADRLLPVLDVVGHSNIKAPNEICFTGFAYDFRAEVRANPSSPWRVDVGADGGYVLRHATRGAVRYVDFPVQGEWNFQTGVHGNPLGAIVHPMGADALRIYPDMTCLMDKPGIKCRFCGTLPKRRSDPRTGRALSDDQIIEEITEAVTAAQAHMPVRHVFMSTGAFYTPAATGFYARIIAALRDVLDEEHAEILFALTPPPASRVRQLDPLYAAGVSDLSFNLEAWDPALWDLNNTDGHLGAFKVRRGKKDHLAAFLRTVERLGRGAAKSNFVAGLEEMATLTEAFSALLSMGVVPSMTVYYPSPGAEWIEAGIDPTCASFRSDAAGFLVNAYLTLAEQTAAAGLSPHWGPDNRISALEWDAWVTLHGRTLPTRVQQRRAGMEAAA